MGRLGGWGVNGGIGGGCDVLPESPKQAPEVEPGRDGPAYLMMITLVTMMMMMLMVVVVVRINRIPGLTASTSCTEIPARLAWLFSALLLANCQ